MRCRIGNRLFSAKSCLRDATMKRSVNAKMSVLTNIVSENTVLQNTITHIVYQNKVKLSKFLTGDK